VTPARAEESIARRAQEPSRYHALDALRGVMMLLGIYLHAAVAYSQHGSWPWKDGSSTALFDISLGLIHLFRMPSFYVMAGFFAALLLERHGTARFLRNRAVRILLPFVVAWAILFPLVRALAITATHLDDPAGIPAHFLQFFTSGEVLRRLDPMHLWFLEYLLIFYAIALIAAPVARRLPAVVGRIDRAFRAIVISPLGPFVLAGISFGTLLGMPQGAIDDPSGFVPNGKILLAYSVFFGCGWLLWRHADLLPALRRPRRAAVFLALGTVTAMLGYAMWYLMDTTGSKTLGGAVATAVCLAASTWLFVFGFIGLFLCSFARPAPWIRYVSDSSYWLYLMHMPVLLAFQIAVAESGWPPAGKAVVVLVASVATLLVSYQFLVRPTWIGAILNGRRHPIGRRPAPAIAAHTH
jgi:peptidoglycan/LPS O-acetylase OafA/YrhL